MERYFFAKNSELNYFLINKLKTVINKNLLPKKYQGNVLTEETPNFVFKLSVQLG